MAIALPGPGLAESFALILGDLRKVIAARMSRPKSVQQRDAFPLLMLLWHRLGRTIKRFAALAEKAKAGPLPLPPIRKANPDRPERTRPPDPLPRGVAWLIRLLAWEAAAYGSQLQHLMSQPEFSAFLEAAPQAGRILRPLCRMLMIPAPVRVKPPRSPDQTPPSRQTPEGAGQPAHLAGTPPDTTPAIA